ncbi:MAG: hydrolase [Alphaproteobacteria bacterium]|nr:N-formylglutamate amidohydrolase [Alphaproteobacteria bacterium]TAD90564.1 MAG: hydrolase [Alphaproteobacteria bacterium]
MSPGGNLNAGYHRPGVLRVFEPSPGVPRVPLVFDSPHSGTERPPEFEPAAPWATVLMASDTHVDQLFRAAPSVGAPLLAALFPRSFLDLNRSLMDMDPELLAEPWPHPLRNSAATRRGMGLMWRYAWGDTAMYARPLGVAEAEARIERYYQPYHELLGQLIDQCQQQFGAVWHVNCHSMPAVGHALSPDPPGTVRPDFVLGDLDGVSCEPGFVALVERTLQGFGYSVSRNVPFKGAELTSKFSDVSKSRNSLQIEINRRLYMNEDTRQTTDGFVGLQRHLSELVERMAAYASERSMPR